MALSSGFDNNLAMALLGVSITGGLAYGGYLVFKDRPKPVTELLKSKKRVLLTKEKEDDKAWLDSWKLYLLAHTKKSAKPANSPGGKPTAPKAKEEFEDNDLWKLEGWANDRTKKEQVPDSFKNKCLSWENEKLSGTWTKEYKEIEKYCSKVENSEETEQ